MLLECSIDVDGSGELEIDEFLMHFESIHDSANRCVLLSKSALQTEPEPEPEPDSVDIEEHDEDFEFDEDEISFDADDPPSWNSFANNAMSDTEIEETAELIDAKTPQSASDTVAKKQWGRLRLAALLPTSIVNTNKTSTQLLLIPTRMVLTLRDAGRTEGVHHVGKKQAS